MKALRIQGGGPLGGRVAASGSKNAALPMMAAALLTPEPLVLRRVPDLRDIGSMRALLALLGVRAEAFDGGWCLQSTAIEGRPVAPYELVRTMRASVLVLGPLLVRWGEAVVSLPGGCAIGARPIDQHLKGFEALGAEIEVHEGYVHARADRLHGGVVRFDMPTVGGTENLMMAAVLADGQTVIENAACEPEIAALADLLRAMGARIEGEGTPTIRIEGVEALHGADAEVIADRIEVGTWLLAALATRGEVTVEGARPEDLGFVLQHLRAVGAEVDIDAAARSIAVRAGGLRTLQPQAVRTAPYPGFPTDLQAQWMSAMATIDGTTEISETIFENRFMHVPELLRMGADIRISGHQAVVHGGRPLSGAPVMATDLRASAGLVIAGLAARGRTDILRIYHLQRGYEALDAKLRALGADVEVYDREATVPDLAAALAAEEAL